MIFIGRSSASEAFDVLAIVGAVAYDGVPNNLSMESLFVSLNVAGPSSVSDKANQLSQILDSMTPHLPRRQRLGKNQ